MENENTSSSFLSRDEILAFEDITTVDFEVPEWGGRKVKMRRLTAAEGMQFANGHKAGSIDGPARIAMMSCVDAEGNRLFSDADLPALLKKSQGAILRIQAKALELNGLTDPPKTDVAAKNA